MRLVSLLGLSSLALFSNFLGGSASSDAPTPFQPQTAFDGPVTFVTLGDWGQPGPNQRAVAKQLVKTMNRENDKPNFFVITGDNFYYDGVTSDDPHYDYQWNSTYLLPYSDPSLQVPWYIVLGNHDHHWYRGQAEVEFYKKNRDNRWYLPGFWYTQTLTYTNSTGSTLSIEFVFIDSSTLGGDSSDPLVSDKLRKQSPQHLAWIEEKVKNSKADWLFFVSHFPTLNARAAPETLYLNKMKPFFMNYTIDAHFCGHEHLLEHHFNKETKVNEYLSGGGGGSLKHDKPDDTQQFSLFDHGFMVHTIRDNELYTEVLNKHGHVVYRSVQSRRPKSWELQDHTQGAAVYGNTKVLSQVRPQGFQFLEAGERAGATATVTEVTAAAAGQAQVAHHQPRPVHSKSNVLQP